MSEDATREPGALYVSGSTETIGMVRGQSGLGEWSIFAAAIVGILAIALYVFVFFQTAEWQMLAQAGFVVLGGLCLLPAWSLVRRKHHVSSASWLLLAVFLFYGSGELLLSGVTVYNVLAGILFVLFLLLAVRPPHWHLWVPAGLLYVLYIVGMNQLQGLPRFDVNEVVFLRLFALGTVVLLMVLIGWQIYRAFQLGNIRTRLLTASVSIVLLPVVILSLGMLFGGLQGVQQRALDQLESVAILSEAEIETWLNDLLIDLGVALSTPELLEQLQTLGRDEQGSAAYAAAYQGIVARLHQVSRYTGRFEELSVVDLDGKVVASTNPDRVDDSVSNQIYFREGLQDAYVQKPVYSPTARRTFFHVSYPIVNGDGEKLGVLGGRVKLDKLNEILARWTGLGQTGETYLVGVNHTLLTPTRTGVLNVWLGTEGINKAVDQQVEGTGVYENYDGKVVVGAYRWLPRFEAALIAEQERSEANIAIYSMLGIVLGAGVFGVLVAIGASLWITRTIADPLTELVETAVEIARGDLARAAVVGREDEVGTLARAFNSMTGQLRDLIDSLEHRVADRTRDLERRSEYLEAAAQVGHAASSELESDRLIQHVVELIRERFDLYYVGLFLLDQTGEWAELAAGTGTAGQEMLARRHRLRTGGDSMIGWSIANRQARFAMDVGEDAIRLATPELPGTRSEAALPLIARDQAMGALTVQSIRPDAFDRDGIVALQTMADQVAVALFNAKLFAERQEALSAAQRAYGEMSSEAWRDILRRGFQWSLRSDDRGITEAGDVRRPEMEQAWSEGRVVQGEASEEGQIPLAIPIRVRNQVIGVLHTYKPADAGGWTEEEVEILEQIMGQLDVALESARLHEDAQRRAVREVTIRRVTERMRAPRDVESILQNTLGELTRALGVPRAYVRLGTEPDFDIERQQRQGPVLPSENSTASTPGSQVGESSGG